MKMLITMNVCGAVRGNGSLGLSNWMVNKAKVEPKTVQGILHHAKIQTTLDLYTQEDGDETLVAQGEYLTTLGEAAPLVQ